MENYKANILKLVSELNTLETVEDIKVKIVSKEDININIVVKENKHKIPVLIKLEEKVYKAESLGIQAIKSIDDGLSVLDKSNSTYKIEIIVSDKAKDGMEAAVKDKHSHKVKKCKRLNSYYTGLLVLVIVKVVYVLISQFSSIYTRIVETQDIKSIVLLIVSMSAIIVIIICLDKCLRQFNKIKNMRTNDLDKSIANLVTQCGMLTTVAAIDITSMIISHSIK